MIVSVRDQENNLHDAAAVTALIAGVCSIAKSKKTLVLQLTDAVADSESVVSILSGKELKLNSLHELYNFSDDGLDAILLRAETSDLTKEHYDDTVTKLLNRENMFDVFKPTAKTALLDMVDPKHIRMVIRNARDIYEYIFIMLPSNSRELMEMAKDMADENIVIVPQGRYVGEIKPDAKMNLIVKEYEPDSKFDLSGMRKKYGVKKLYTIPHNVGFRDAVIMENLLDFILTNRKPIREDDNYMLTASVNELLGHFMQADTSSDEEEAALLPKPEAERKKGSTAQALPESAVQEVTTVKKGFFRREKSTQIMIDLPVSGHEPESSEERSISDGN